MESSKNAMYTYRGNIYGKYLHKTSCTLRHINSPQ